MKHGDFTDLAKHYHNRPGYNPAIIEAILSYIGRNSRGRLRVADVGAGTGKLTILLAKMGLDVIAVEPNNAMREEGEKYCEGYPIIWVKGSGEDTTLDTGSVDWVIMASSFHWTDPSRSLPEFHRILRKGGFLTVMWNPRDIKTSKLQKRIEKRIYQIVPSLRRISSGAKGKTKDWEKVLVSTGHFSDVIFMEVGHVEVMSRERYLGCWHSVNDIRVQAGESRWREIIKVIEKETEGLQTIEVPYRIRAWTARRVDR